MQFERAMRVFAHLGLRQVNSIESISRTTVASALLAWHTAWKNSPSHNDSVMMIPIAKPLFRRD